MGCRLWGRIELDTTSDLAAAAGNPGGSHPKTFNLITFIRTLFPNKEVYIHRVWFAFFFFLSFILYWSVIEYSFEGLMLKLKLQYFGHLMQRVDSLEKTDAGRGWGQEEKGTTEDEMAGWHQ